MRSKIAVVAIGVIAGLTLLALAVTNLVGCGEKEECPPCPTLSEYREMLDGDRSRRPKGCTLAESGCPSVDHMLIEDVTHSFGLIEDYRLGGAR